MGKIAWLVLGVGAIVVSVACGASEHAARSKKTRPAGWPDQLRLGMAGVNDAEAALERNAPVARRIQDATGIPTKFFTLTSYSSVVEAMRAKRIDGMQVGVFSYILAVEQARAEAVAVYISSYGEPAVYDPLLRPDYYSVICVKKGNGIRSLADLKGRTFNFVEPASTSGHLVPRNELIRAGLVPDKDVKTRFAGDHAASIISLWNGKADAAAASEPSLRLLGRRQIEYCGFPDHEIGRARTAVEIKAVFDACPDGRIAAIHYSFPIPGTPFALRADLPADLKAAIKASLLATPGDAEFIRAAKRWYVDPSVEKGLPNLDAYYDEMRAMARLLDLDLHGLD